MSPRTIKQVILVLIPCLAALSCAGTIQPPAEALPLNAEQLLLRKAEILRAEDLRLTDDSLLSAIAAQSPELRAMAARAMGRIGDPSLRPLLEKRLQDPESAVRAEAAFALGLLGDRDALPALRTAALDATPAVRKRVASALGLLHDPAGEGTVISLLGDPEPEVVAAACYSLPLFDKSGFAIDQLLTLIDERGAEVGLAALRALAWIASDPAFLSFDEQVRVRERLTTFANSEIGEARSLAALGLARPVLIEEAELLGRLALEDPDARVRFGAIRSLSFPGAPIEPFVSEALKDQGDLVVLAAVQGLGRMKGERAIEALAALVIHDSRPWLRKLAVAMAGRVGPSRAAAMANGLSRDDDPELRAASARLLYGRTDQASLTIAERLLGDGEILVRAAAIPAMAGAEGMLSEVLGLALREEEPLIRIALADAAGRRLAAEERNDEDRRDALNIIQQLWNGANEPDEAAVRLAAMEAAGRAGAQREVRVILEEGLRSDDRQLRQRARDLMRALFGETPAEEAYPPLAEYVEILRWTEKPRAAVITVERPGFIPGYFTIALDTASAPLTSWHFARLAEEWLFDLQEVKHLVPGLIVQSGGDEREKYIAHDEINPSAFDPGTVGLVSAGNGLTSSRWFISQATQPLLSANHTAFGKVVQNYPGVVALLLPGDRIVSIRVYEGDGSEEVEQP